MKGKTLLLLLCLFGILFGVSQISRNSKRSPSSQDGWASGERPFAALDLNAAGTVSLSRGSESVTLEKREGSWVVKDLYNYPAAFSRLTGLLRALPERNVGEAISNPDPFLEEYGLLSDSDNPPTLLTLLGTDGSSLLQLSLGASRPASEPYMAPGQGQFIQLNDGQVLLLDEALSGAFTDPKEWLQRDLLDLSEADLAAISVTLAGESYTLKVKGSGQYEMADLKEGETLKSYEPGRVVRSVQNLQIASIADPANDESGYGLWEGGTLKAEMKDGRSYTISIGEKTAAGKHRYLDIKPEFHPPAKPDLDGIAAQITNEKMKEAGDSELDEQALSSAIKSAYDEAMASYREKNDAAKKRVEEEAAFFKAWTFEVLNSTAESMITSRDELVEAQEEKDEAQE